MSTTIKPSDGEKGAPGGGSLSKTSHKKSESVGGEMQGYVHEPKNVNVHQFYPVLEHTFTKSASRFAEEQQHQMEVAIKQFVEEENGGGMRAITSGGDDGNDADGGELQADANNCAENDPQVIMIHIAFDKYKIYTLKQFHQTNDSLLFVHKINSRHQASMFDILIGRHLAPNVSFLSGVETANTISLIYSRSKIINEVIISPSIRFIFHS